MNIKGGFEATYFARNAEPFVLQKSVPIGGGAPVPEPVAADAGAPSAPPVVPVASAPAGAPGLLHVHCDKPCSVFLDGAKKSADQKDTDVKDVAPGKHKLATRDTMSDNALIEFEMPGGSEVFVFAKGTDSRVTNTKPLAP